MVVSRIRGTVDISRNGRLRPASSVHRSDMVPMMGSLMASHITPRKTMVPARAGRTPAIFVRKKMKNAPTNSVMTVSPKLAIPKPSFTGMGNSRS